MILVDVNLLLYAALRAFPQHAAARRWLDGAINAPERVGMPWPSLLGFVRIASNPRVFSRPMAVATAWDQVEAWLARATVWIPLPTDRHAQALAPLLRAHARRREHVPDAHLAALAIEHGLELCSTDGDFARFPGLRWQNPLAVPPP